MANLNQLRLFRNIHMRGIGGTSMSGIAEMLKHWGFHVTGSDDNSSELTDKLISRGIPVTIGYDFDNLSKASLVVYTAAIKQDDPELLRAQELNIPIVERSDFLGEITKAFEDTICISGTHGKTTTTSMISLYVRFPFSSVPFGPLTVTTLFSAISTVTPAGIAIGCLPIRDISKSSLT